MQHHIVYTTVPDDTTYHVSYNYYTTNNVLLYMLFLQTGAYSSWRI